MQILNTLQPDYTAYRGYYQIKLPLEMETMIPADDPVRLLSAFVEGMDLSDLYATYDRIRKNQATPRQMLKISIYAAMINTTFQLQSHKSANGIRYVYYTCVASVHTSGGCSNNPACPNTSA